MKINIGILGLGTVGCGTLDVLKRNAAVITPRAGCEIVVKRIATAHPDKPRPIEIDKSLVTDDVNEILNDPDIKIVAELIGGVEPARDYVIACHRRRQIGCHGQQRTHRQTWRGNHRGSGKSGRRFSL